MTVRQFEMKTAINALQILVQSTCNVHVMDTVFGTDTVFTV